LKIQYLLSRWKRLLKEYLCAAGEQIDFSLGYLDSNLRGIYITNNITLL
jgi:hypothetical protein